jgi:rhodanese-related sulfurtransferase
MQLEQIAPQELAHWARAQGAARLLDVREPWEVERASVGGSPALGSLPCLHIPMMELPQRLHELGDADDAPATAVLCHHGVRSMQVAAWLAHQGYVVANVRGGIDAWSRQADAQVPIY